ncbi:SH3 domain-containing protein [Ectobacillus sp. sgz5001026]|uniref:SH3 domain-containing protein n=1 Tax=Ectobacillus sp. sgz5001026 TaxID=3242473 RepID=UPI0036D31584
MGFSMKYDVIPQYLTSPSLRRSGLLIQKVVFIVAHDTGNTNSTAAENVSYYESSRNEISASAHLFVDDKQIIECIPALTNAPEKAWHVRYEVTGDNERFGVDANDAAIGVELCFSDNGSIDNEEAYKRYVWVLAYICYRFGLDPSTSIIGHEELDPSRREDPSNALRYTGRTFSNLVQDVVNEFNASSEGDSPEPVPQPSPNGIGIATVLVDSLNVRTEPSLNGSIVKVVNKGGAYIVYSEQNGWYNVGGNEWISAKPQYVTFTPNGQTIPPPAQVTSGIATILADALNVRSAPSINGSIVKVVYKGEAYQVYYEQNGWYNVGGNEWISANSAYVSFVPSGTSASQPNVTGIATILVRNLNVRATPNMTGRIVKTVKKGEKYIVFSEQNGWYNVGGNEWINANPRYVSFQSN